MASILRARKNELTDAQIAAVQLSNRKQYGAYVTYEALSSNGVDKYIVTLRDGRATWCECPSTVPCKHRASAEFEEEWTAPVAKTEPVWHDDDTTAHVEDSIRSGEFEYEVGEMEEEALGIIAEEYERKVQAEVASLPDIDRGMMDMIDEMQAEKRRKMAANQAYRDVYPGDYGYCDAA